MTPEQAFLADIQADPDNDTPRLIFADWLTDHGDPRGEFIQVQCRLAAMTEDDPEYEDLMDRQGELLVQSRAEWLRPIAELARESHCLFRRGFAEDVRTSPAAFLKHGSGLVQQPPLRWLRTSLGPEPLDKDLAANTLWHHVRGLTLGVPLMANANLALLSNLHHLDISGTWVTPGGIGELLGSTELASLREIIAAGMDSKVRDSGAARLAGHPGLSRITHLNLDHNDIRSKGALALARSPHTGNLRVLSLRQNPIRSAGLQALAAGNFPGLRELHLGSTKIKQDDLRALLGAPWMRQITHLNLESCGLGTAHARILAEAPGLGNLRVLQLWYNGIDSEGLTALAASPHLSKLRSLGLGYNSLDVKGLQALASSATFTRLQRLELAGRCASLEEARALAASPHLNRLETLVVAQGAGTEILRERFPGSVPI